MMLDHESRGHADHHDALRLWLRLLSTTQLIEGAIRRKLRERFDTTLARFDLMAQLERSPDGLLMRELSARLMVTGGNVTGLTDQLTNEGLVERRAVPDDRRAFRVRLTRKGKTQFNRMAREHEAWVIAMMQDLTPPTLSQLYATLDTLKHSVKEHAQ